MMVFLVDDVKVSFIGIRNATEKEAQNYVDYVRKHKTSPERVTSIFVTACDDDMVDVEYILQGEKFERIRRITGYLVGSLERWNDSKQAEEKDRIKHGKIE